MVLYLIAILYFEDLLEHIVSMIDDWFYAIKTKNNKISQTCIPESKVDDTATPQPLRCVRPRSALHTSLWLCLEPGTSLPVEEWTPCPRGQLGAAARGQDVGGGTVVVGGTEKGEYLGMIGIIDLYFSTIVQKVL